MSTPNIFLATGHYWRKDPRTTYLDSYNVTTSGKNNSGTKKLSFLETSIPALIICNQTETYAAGEIRLKTFISLMI